MSSLIRPARPGDEADIVEMIHSLARFERAPEQCTVDENHIRAALFGADPVAQALIAECDGETAAMAVWPMPEWISYRVSGPELSALAASS